VEIWKCFSNVTPALCLFEWWICSLMFLQNRDAPLLFLLGQQPTSWLIFSTICMRAIIPATKPRWSRFWTIISGSFFIGLRQRIGITDWGKYVVRTPLVLPERHPTFRLLFYSRSHAGGERLAASKLLMVFDVTRILTNDCLSICT
jgi:hypothetical protein